MDSCEFSPADVDDLRRSGLGTRTVQNGDMADHLHQGAPGEIGDLFRQLVLFFLKVGEFDLDQFVQQQFRFDSGQERLAHAVMPHFEDGFEQLPPASEAAAVGGSNFKFQAAIVSLLPFQLKPETPLFPNMGYMKHFFLKSGLSLSAGATLLFAVTAQAGLIKASPAPPSGFLENPQRMNRDDRAPFNKVWRNPSQGAWNRVQGFDRVVIMPVNTAYLKMHPKQRADVEKMAAYMREQFQKEFAKDGKYRVMLKPGPKTYQVELALVRLRPTNVPGNVLFTGAGVLAPGASFVGSQFTHGDIAFEAKLRNAETGELLGQYADSQRDKTSPFSFRDYSAYAHDRKAVDDWARQMRQLANAPRGTKVPGAMRVTMNPF